MTPAPNPPWFLKCLVALVFIILPCLLLVSESSVFFFFQTSLFWTEYDAAVADLPTTRRSLPGVVDDTAAIVDQQGEDSASAAVEYLGKGARASRPPRYLSCSMSNETLTDLPVAPHFIVAGAQKGGTSALFQILGDHPGLLGSKERESHFFDFKFPEDDDNRRAGKPWSVPEVGDDIWCIARRKYLQEWQLDDTSTLEKDLLLFEKTPSYLYYRQIPSMILRTCPWRPKIIVVLRDPIDRALSHYRMTYSVQLKKGETDIPSFTDLVAREIQSMRKVGLTKAPPMKESERSSQNGTYDFDAMDFELVPDNEKMEAAFSNHLRAVLRHNYIHRGMYYSQLANWHRYFPINSSMLVLNYDDFKTNPESVHHRILEFVGAPYVPHSGGNLSEVRGLRSDIKPASSDERLLPSAAREYLRDYFRPYNQALAKLLGDEWKGVWGS